MAEGPSKRLKPDIYYGLTVGKFPMDREELSAIEHTDWADRPLRLRNTGVWLTFSLKSISKWKDLKDI